MKLRVVRKKRAYPEDELQRSVCEALDLHQVRYYAVPNGGKREKREAARLQGLGVKAGVPDLCITSPPPACPEVRGVYIELKAGKRKPTEAQLAWHGWLRADGCRVAVARSLDEVLALLSELGYLAGKPAPGSILD